VSEPTLLNYILSLIVLHANKSFIYKAKTPDLESLSHTLGLLFLQEKKNGIIDC